MNHFKTIFILILVGCLSAPENALSELDRLLKDSEITVLSDNITKNPNNLRSRLFLADHYFKKKQFGRVIHYLEPMADSLPDKALFKLSQSYFSIGDNRLAESMAVQLLNRTPVSTKNHINAIRIFTQIIDRLDPTSPQRQPLIDQIFATLKKAKKQDPKNLLVYEVWLANLEKYIPHFGFEALRIIEDMRKNKIKLQPKHYSQICHYSFQAKFIKETQTACLKAISLDPDEPSNHIYLGRSHINAGEEDKGKRVLASVGEKFSGSEEALWATAESHFKNKQMPEAYSFYKKASLHEHAKPRDFLGLAKAAFELKKFNEALEAFTKHCRMTRYLDQEFRRASGLLKKRPEWHTRYRQRMMACKP